ncbi:MAG TPA: hypothetical protein VF737_02850 [Gemmatimonadaceae bacterium]
MLRSLVPLAVAAAACGKPIGGSESNGGAPGSAPASSRDASGVVILERDGGAAVRIDVDECWSGQMLEFRGVELFHDPVTTQRVRLVDDPVAGPRVVLVNVIPGRDRVVLAPDACSTFESRIESGNSTLNDIRSLRGTLKLSCAVPGAGMLGINVTFSDCSFDNRAQAL